MKDLIEAARAALNYLDCPRGHLWPVGTTHDIIAGLREALAAAEAQPRREPGWNGPMVEAQPVSEPVAWIEHFDGSIAYNPYRDAAIRLPNGVRFDLFAAPVHAGHPRRSRGPGAPSHRPCAGPDARREREQPQLLRAPVPADEGGEAVTDITQRLRDPSAATCWGTADNMMREAADEIDLLREALQLIAAPMRPDGTYNRDRRACELLARAALGEP